MTDAVKNAFKASAFTSLFTFVATFGITLLGWLTDVAEWASQSGAVQFPGLSVLGYGVVAAVVAGASGIVNFIVRFAQAKNVVPGAGPVYQAPEPPEIP